MNSRHAQEAPARPRLVAELHLHLVEVLRQIAVAADLAARDVGDDLLVRRAEVVVAPLAVLEAEERVAVEVPAARLLEVLGGQERGHEDLERAGAVHLLADDAPRPCAATR